MTEYRFSKHALYQVKQRKLNIDLINAALQIPYKAIRDDSGLLIVQKNVKENNKTYLYRVFVNDEHKPPLVVTVYKTSKLTKYEN